MNGKIKNIVTAALSGAFIAGFSLWGILQPDKDISVTERRKLASFPELKTETVESGKFMSGFETYGLDNFPMREQFRKLKAFTSYYIMRKKENNSIYISDGYASKTDFDLNRDSVSYACRRFSYVYEKYLTENNSVYFSVIPDKNYFLSGPAGCPSADLSEMTDIMKKDLSFAEYIDIVPTLEISDYYRTDTHWRQERITDTAEKLCEKMGTSVYRDHKEKKMDQPFYGVYYGQAALPMEPDDIVVLENEHQNGFRVFDYESGKEIPLYTYEAMDGLDPYEVYLSGPRSLITIENPDSLSDKELIVFRDSFGSSIAPLLAEGYRKTTLIDIRYMHPDIAGRFIDFSDQDVLFMYSSLVLNNSNTIK